MYLYDASLFFLTINEGSLPSSRNDQRGGE